MSRHRKSFFWRTVVGLPLSLMGLTGCENGATPTQPATGGAGIPGLRGPAAPKAEPVARKTAGAAPSGKSPDAPR
jgi:hypothetical protein